MVVYLILIYIPIQCFKIISYITFRLFSMYSTDRTMQDVVYKLVPGLQESKWFSKDAFQNFKSATFFPINTFLQVSLTDYGSVYIAFGKTSSFRTVKIWTFVRPSVPPKLNTLSILRPSPRIFTLTVVRFFLVFLPKKKIHAFL